MATELSSRLGGNSIPTVITEEPPPSTWFSGGVGRVGPYLGEPKEVLHEGAAVGVVHLHDGDLVLGRHQQTVLLVEHRGQVHAPADDRKLNAGPRPKPHLLHAYFLTPVAASFIPVTIIQVLY